MAVKKKPSPKKPAVSSKVAAKKAAARVVKAPAKAALKPVVAVAKPAPAKVVTAGGRMEAALKAPAVRERQDVLANLMVMARDNPAMAVVTAVAVLLALLLIFD